MRATHFEARGAEGRCCSLGEGDGSLIKAEGTSAPKRRRTEQRLRCGKSEPFKSGRRVEPEARFPWGGTSGWGFWAMPAPPRPARWNAPTKHPSPAPPKATKFCFREGHWAPKNTRRSSNISLRYYKKRIPKLGKDEQFWHRIAQLQLAHPYKGLSPPPKVLQGVEQIACLSHLDSTRIQHPPPLSLFSPFSRAEGPQP